MDIETLINTNQRIIDRWIADGLDISKKVELDFYLHLSSKDDCIEARKLCRAKFKLPKDGLYVDINEHDGFALNVNLPTEPNPILISEIELNLMEVAKEFTNSEVTWEFKAPKA